MCVRDAILAQNNYCAKTSPDPNTHSGSWVHNVLGARAPRTNLEYDRETAILFRPLTQPVTCEMVLYIFVSMI